MKDKTILTRSLIKVATKLSKEFGLLKSDNRNEELFRSESNNGNYIVVRRRFLNLRLDVKFNGFTSVEYNVDSLKYSESQIFHNGIELLSNLKNSVDNEIIKFKKENKEFKNNTLKLLSINDFVSNENREKFSKNIRFNKIDMNTLIFEELKEKYLLKYISKNVYINEKDRILLNFDKDNYVSIERLIENKLNPIYRDLARINFNGYTYATGQIFHEDGFELFEDIYNAIIKAKVKLYLKN